MSGDRVNWLGGPGAKGSGGKWRREFEPGKLAKPLSEPTSPARRVRRVMRILLAVFLTTFALGALLSLLGLWLIYSAMAYVPPFYGERTRWQDDELQGAYDKLVERISHVISALKRTKSVEGIFTEDELNGWLAVQAPRLWRGQSPLTIHKPRLELADRCLRVGAEIRTQWARGIAWFELEPEVRGPNVIAVRIREARLGRIPLPTDRLAQLVVSGYLSETVGAHRAAAFWERSSDGRPVLVLQLDPTPDPNSPDRVQIEQIRLGEGALAVRLRVVRTP